MAEILSLLDARLLEQQDFVLHIRIFTTDICQILCFFAVKRVLHCWVLANEQNNFLFGIKQSERENTMALIELLTQLSLLLWMNLMRKMITL